MTTTRKMRVGVLTGGGDCAGLNPAIKWVVNTALDPELEKKRGFGYEITGIKNGWKGLAFTGDSAGVTEENTISLTMESVRTWDRFGGTNLGSSRFNPYNPKNDTSRLVIENIGQLGLDALLCIGGEDTLGVAARLSRDGIKVVGIPKTIDKDLPGTEYTLGFETAVEVIVDMVDKLRTTAGSHSRILVLETMGRHAGWLTLKAGEAAGASFILIPEYNFSMEKLLEMIKGNRKAGSRYEIILVAEGAKPTGGMEVHKDDRVDAFGHKTLGGIGTHVADEIAKHTGVESRCVVLGHIQRGGAPCAYDRRMGRYFGIGAVNMITRKQFGSMVCLKEGRISSVAIENVLGNLHLVDVETMYDTTSYNGVKNILT